MPTVLCEGKGDTFELDLLYLIFHGTAITGLAQNNASPIASLYVALHSVYPEDSSTSATSELTYTSYQRVAIARSSSGWTVNTLAGTVGPADPIVFPTNTGTTQTAVAFSVTTAVSGTSKLLYRGYINPEIVVSNGVAPTLGIGTFIGED
jgi:hypothetical protein